MATAVVSLGLVGMIQALVSGTEMLDLAKKQTIASQVIHGQLELVHMRNWTQIGTLAASTTVNVDDVDQSTNITAGFVFGSNLPTIGKRFTCTRTISTVRTDLKQVTFSVSWTGNRGRAYTRTGSTYVGKNGLYVTYQR